MDILNALEEPEQLSDAFIGPKTNLTGFVDLGWIYPRFLADESKNSDYRYIESANAQYNNAKLGTRTFAVNEVDLGFDVSYSDFMSGNVSVFIYPSTSTNALLAYSSLEEGSGQGINQVAVGVKQAYIDLSYPGSLNMFLRIGKVPSLLGIEQEIFQAPDLASVAPSIIGPLSYGYPQGIQIRAHGLANDNLEYGLGITHDANNLGNTSPTNVTRNLPAALADDNLVLAGRLAFGQGVRNRFTVGISGQIGEKGSEKEFNDGSFWSFHPFIKLRLDPFDNANLGPFRIRTEYLIMDIEHRRGVPPNNASQEMGKYDLLYDATRHQGLSVWFYTDLFRRFTLTLGYSYIDSYVTVSGDPTLSTPERRFLDWGARRVQFAARYRVYDNVAIKAELQKNYENGNEPSVDNDVLAMSLVYSL